jgi:Bacterial type II and III secretion system protein
MNRHKITTSFKNTPVALAASLVIALSGCATTGTGQVPSAEAAGFVPLQIAPSSQQLSSLIQRSQLTNASRQLAAHGIKAMDERAFKRASDFFNLALKTDLNNSQLHFLNALTYHYRGLEGESALLGLAEQGYDMAVQFDPSNSMARHFRGLLHLDRREYARAQHHLAEAALYRPDDTELMQDLAVAAYYNKDPKTAFAALESLKDRGVQTLQDFNLLRGLALTSASLGDAERAKLYLESMRKSGAPVGQSDFVAKRLKDWEVGYASGMLKTQFGPGPGSQPSGGFQQPGQFGGSPQPGQFGQPNQSGARPGTIPGPAGVGTLSTQLGAFVDKQMVMVDVVIVSADEDNSNTMGVNLLDGLKLQFGNTAGTPAWSRGTAISNDLLTGQVTSATRAVTRQIGLSGVSYTLNIANASDRSNEVLARPTLVALSGQTSQFFSGTDIVGAAVSSGQGSAVQVQKEVGVRLSVTPEFLPDNLIRLQVIAERTFLTNPSSNVVFDFRLDTTKTLVNANVAMKFGETLILSGLSERDKGVDNSGVPGLRDVPLVQYLFSRKSERDFQKSILILVTPRRAQYLQRDQADIDEERSKMSERERIQSEFDDKYRTWLKLIPNTAFVSAGLAESPLFREFRTGDLQMPNWVSRKSHFGRMQSVLSFLYY